MRLSIITVNLNNKAGLERTLQSVFAQTNHDFESIVVDGLSSDGSRDVITAHAARIAKWVSEKDSGVYNAMNKGIRMAEGEYVLFLNAGDSLCSRDTLDGAFRRGFSEDFVFFDAQLVKRDGSEIWALNRSPQEVLVLGYIAHQAVLHRRSVFQHLGLYSEDYRLAADYELFLRAFFTAGCSYQVVHQVLCVYDNVHGMSSDVRNAALLRGERRKAQKAVFHPAVVDALEHQHETIEGLVDFKDKYEGLMASNTVRIALGASALLRRVRRLAGRRTPG
ncbi:MAG TPA: glycosyltransferase family 2 protein [Candidatus Paceibacterota bacterium]|nr:glycosyltransferase family 2 protein [Candidatus Paceibacterota bacterium]